MAQGMRGHPLYDAYGNQTSITDPIGTGTTGDPNDRVTQFTYDHLNRQIGRTLPEGMSESMMYYDADDAPAGEYYGLLKEAIDFEGRVTTYVYDQYGRLDTKTYYDSVTDQTNNNPARTIEYTYDAFGRTIEMDDSGHGPSGGGGGLTTTKYDAEGRTVQIDSPEGVLNYAYDALGRMIRTYTTATAASTDAVSDTRHHYDALGRLTGVTMVERNNTAVQGETVTWNGSSITGEHTAYFYDTVGNLERVEQTTHDGTSAHTLSMKYTYDAFNRLTDLHHFIDGNANQTADTGEWVASFHYDLDKLGNRIQADERFDLNGDGSFDAGQGNGGVDLLQTFNWVYDNLNRLIEESFDLGSNGTADTLDYITRYAFGLASNRQQVLKDVGNAIASSFSVDETTDYTYDENDRLLTEQKSGSSTEYTEYEYGPNTDLPNGYGGDSTTQTRKTVYTDDTKTTKVSETTFAYDAMGRQAQVVEQEYDAGGILTSTKTTDYTYNAQGLRVAEFDGTDTKTYLFDPQNHTGYGQVFEEYINGTLAKAFTLGHDVVTEVHINGTPGNDSGTPLTFVYDGHGSTRVLLDAAMTLAEKSSGPGILQVFTYDAYGNMMDQSTIVVASKALAGTIVDALTNLLYSGEFTNRNGVQYLRARWYDPSSGRFSRVDPFSGIISDPISLHKYLYTHGNPISGTDPTGLFTLKGLAVASLISGGLAGITGGAYSAAKGQSASQIARATGVSFLVGFASTFALLPAVLSGGAAIAAAGGASAFAGQFLIGSILGGVGTAFAAANLREAIDNGDTVDRVFAGVNVGLAAGSTIFGRYTAFTYARTGGPISQQAAQGQLSAKYSADDGHDGWVNRNSIIYGSVPSETGDSMPNWFTTAETVISSKGSSTTLFQQLLQVSLRGHSPRKQIGIYRVKSDTQASWSTARSNTGPGAGGGDQVFIPSPEGSLELIGTIPLDP